MWRIKRDCLNERKQIVGDGKFIIQLYVVDTKEIMELGKPHLASLNKLIGLGNDHQWM